MKANFSAAIIFCFIMACKNDKPKQIDLPFKSKKDYEETIIASHQLFLKKESERIKKYIDSLGIDFTKTGTGLRYAIVNDTDGESINRGDVVLVKYLLSSLEGDTLYFTEKGQSQEFTVDYEDIESGLHEGVKQMQVGEEAILILPAHLGHGITGDQAAIPSQTTLVYQIKLLGKR